LSKKTFEAAAETGNFLLAQVKDNQPTLAATLQTLSAARPSIDRIDTIDRHGHGRYEHRTVEVFDVAGRLGPDWDGLIVSAARVTRFTLHKDTKSGLWHPTEEVSYYACQTALRAAEFAAAIRSHWHIENRCNHVRDVTFLEDASRIRTKPGHFARIRSIVLNLVRANGATNVKQELYKNALNFDNILAYRVT
jgi:predicted transposase YbfD/YdcC